MPRAEVEDVVGRYVHVRSSGADRHCTPPGPTAGSSGTCWPTGR
jgi:hypothetical protein